MLEFTKMHSLGNDFVMLNDVRRVLDLSTDQIQRIADRHRGIGCDQVIVAQSAQEGVDLSRAVSGGTGIKRASYDFYSYDDHKARVEGRGGLAGASADEYASVCPHGGAL